MRLPEESRNRVASILQECIIQPAAKHSDLVLAADVLANSLNYHFRNRPAGEKFGPLNIKDAVVTHPIARLLNVHQGPLVRDFADNFFAHPLSLERPKAAPPGPPIKIESINDD